MKWEKIREKLRAIPSKLGKKTVITVCTVLVLGCVVVLNVLLFTNDKWGNGKEGMHLAVDLSGKNTSDEDKTPTMQAYFSSMTLNRQQARDEAMEVLQAVADSQTALEEVKQAALQDMNKLATDMEKENAIETMILSKGFAQCIAVINNDSCNVIVESDGLAPGEVAQITEIVYEQAGIHPANLKIVEKSGDSADA